MAEASCRRAAEATGYMRCPRSSRRLVVAAATSATTGAIRSAAAASARPTMVGPRPGAGAGDQVTVTDSHHPALRMAPAASSRRQCPRDSSTCSRHSPWFLPGSERPQVPRILTLCAGLRPSSPAKPGPVQDSYITPADVNLLFRSRLHNFVAYLHRIWGRTPRERSRSRPRPANRSPPTSSGRRRRSEPAGQLSGPAGAPRVPAGR